MHHGIGHMVWVGEVTTVPPPGSHPPPLEVTPPLPRKDREPGNMVNERAVRILLEYILVSQFVNSVVESL